MPFSGVPQIRGETVAKNIPDPVYRQHQEGKDLKASGWDFDRAVRTIRKGVKETETGHVYDPTQTGSAA